MAGRPKRKAAMVLLQEKGIGEIVEKVATGGSIRSIALELGISQSTLHEWLTAPERVDHYSRARVRRAERLAEETLEIADAASPEDAQVARLRMDARKWVASKMDRATWGDDRAGLAVNINLGDLHLQALRKAQPVVRDVVDVDAIVVRDESSDER